MSDARAIMGIVHETQHDSDSEDEFPVANDSSQSQQVVVALADAGASRHVMCDAVVANSGRFHVLSSGMDEASSGALRNVAQESTPSLWSHHCQQGGIHLLLRGRRSQQPGLARC